ncbi:MAG: hypothetical protein GY926_12400 [bacterium]|nr:hypothetical protein [bacterium]
MNTDLELAVRHSYISNPALQREHSNRATSCRTQDTSPRSNASSTACSAIVDCKRATSVSSSAIWVRSV